MFFDQYKCLYENFLKYPKWDLSSRTISVTDRGAVLDATFTAIGNPTSTATFKMDYNLSGDFTAKGLSKNNLTVLGLLVHDLYHGPTTPKL